MNIVLTTNGLSKRYGSIKAVDNLNLQVPKGSVYGLLGPNGSGKTTTLSIIMGATHSTSGSYSWFGKGNEPHLRKRIGTLLEKPNFIPNLNAVKNLKITAEIKGIGYDNIGNVLKTVGLYERQHYAFKTFSLGMKQRLAIAAVLLSDPEVLVLDEPTNGLDPKGIVEVREIIRNVAKSGKTVILASHLLDEVEKVCTHVAILKNGVLKSENALDSKDQKTDRLFVDAPDQKLLGELLTQYPLDSLQYNDVFWQAEVSDTFDVAALNTWLVQQNCSPSMIRKVKPKLEEAFMKAIGEDKI